MSKVATISEEDMRYERDHRLLRCPKCGKWNRVGYQNLIDKVFVVTCEQCGTKYLPI